MLRSLRSYLGRRLHRRAAAPPSRGYGAPATLGPIACGLRHEYVETLRQAAGQDGPDGEPPDHQKAADLVRWGYLGYDEQGEYRLTEAGRAALDRGNASHGANVGAGERAAHA